MSAPETFMPASDEVTINHSWSSADVCQTLTISSDCSLVEVSELEYTHLQHAVYSHLQAEVALPGGNNIESARLVGGLTLRAEPCVTPVSNHSESGSKTPNRTLIPSTPDNFVSVDSSQQGQPNLLENQVIVLSDPIASVLHLERTPKVCGEVPSEVLARIRDATDNISGQKPNSKGGREVRSAPSARVRLEKRFSCSPCKVPSRQGHHQSALSNFLSMLQHPTDVLGVTVQSELSKCMKTGRNKLASLGLTKLSYPVHSSSICGSINPSPQTQALSGTCGETRSAAEGQIWVKLAGGPREMIPASHGHSVARPLCPERHALVDIQNRIGVAGGVKTRRGGISKGRVMGESLLRRERHNIMERDRRRRIRSCCDELNLLVPFCNLETDKATTLHWTTAFLKFITETQGDKLKQEFLNSFCGKTEKQPDTCEDTLDRAHEIKEN